MEGEMTEQDREAQRLAEEKRAADEAERIRAEERAAAEAAEQERVAAEKAKLEADLVAARAVIAANPNAFEDQAAAMHAANPSMDLFSITTALKAGR